MKLLMLTLVFGLLLTQISHSQVSPTVRSMDFRNFTYPVVGTKSAFTLTNGQFGKISANRCAAEYKLKGVTYFDLTGDGEDEAIAEVTESVPCGSRTTKPLYYVYSLFGNRPRFLRQRSAEYDPVNPRLIDIKVDKYSITYPCPPRFRSQTDSCTDGPEKQIKISAILSGPISPPTTLDLEVSGGRITGSGTRANWDVSELDPGTYSLTGSIVTGQSRSQPRTLSITIAECPDCTGGCECPTITVSGPKEGAKAGDLITFTANLSGGRQDEVTYNWSVSEGTIVTGQGTPSIQVQTAAAMAGKKVTATVEVGGIDPACSCNTTASSDSPELGS